MPLPKVECSFDIPKPFRWNDSFKVFYHGLDAEHKVLFDSVFNVNEKRGDKGTFDLAAKKFKEHFVHEEADIKKGVDSGTISQTYLTAHAAAHNKFLEVFGSFKLPVGDDEVDYSMKWLVNHIKAMDFEYKEKIPQ